MLKLALRFAFLASLGLTIASCFVSFGDYRIEGEGGSGARTMTWPTSSSTSHTGAGGWGGGGWDGGTTTSSGGWDGGGGGDAGCLTLGANCGATAECCSSSAGPVVCSLWCCLGPGSTCHHADDCCNLGCIIPDGGSYGYCE